MSGRIYLDRDGADGVIKKIEAQITAISQTAGEIDKLMNSLGQYWDGNLYNKTMDTYNSEYHDTLTKSVPDMVRQLNDFVKSCKKNLEDADRA